MLLNLQKKEEQLTFNFIQLCISGDALMSEVDDFIHKWHTTDTTLKIYEYLGMTKKEYALFVEDEGYLASIVTAHKENMDISNVVEDLVAMAARSDSQAKSRRLEGWLKDEGLWD